jgi:DNA-binding winged helix-turn-helix (wHTH) protein
MSTAGRERGDARRFLFDGVMIDAAAARLFVDRRERSCSRRALQLLVVLCESAGVALSRERLIDRLWPGRPRVPDEALTQAVFRARACLDRYADRLVTVRGIGLRLDAMVRCDDGFAPIESTADASAIPPAAQAASAASIAPLLQAGRIESPSSVRVPNVTRHGARANPLLLAAGLLLLALLVFWLASRSG